jgi:hypothetical protein
MAETEFWRDLKPITNVFTGTTTRNRSSPTRSPAAGENGDPAGHFDVFDYIELCRAHYETVGLGAAYVDQWFR